MNSCRFVTIKSLIWIVILGMHSCYANGVSHHVHGVSELYSKLIENPSYREKNKIEIEVGSHDSLVEYNCLNELLDSLDQQISVRYLQDDKLLHPAKISDSAQIQIMFHGDSVNVVFKNGSSWIDSTVSLGLTNVTRYLDVLLQRSKIESNSKSNFVSVIMDRNSVWASVVPYLTWAEKHKMNWFAPVQVFRGVHCRDRFRSFSK